MRRLLRYLRIAFTLLCGMACVLLIMLWVRSHRQLDVLHVRPPELRLSASSLNGKLLFVSDVAPRRNWDTVHPWEITSEDVRGSTYLWPSSTKPQYSRFGVRLVHERLRARSIFFSSERNAYYVELPHYYPIAAIVSIAGIPWIPWSWRFSLRTLFIAITLVAAALGTIVAFAR